MTAHDHKAVSDLQRKVNELSDEAYAYAEQNEELRAELEKLRQRCEELESLAKRVAGAPVAEIKECCGHAIIGSDWDDDLTNFNLLGKRVALVEIVGVEEGNV